METSGRLDVQVLWPPRRARALLRRVWLDEQFIRFLGAGVVATLVDFAVLVVLKAGLDWHYLEANALSFMTGNLVSYALCVGWVFNVRALSNRRLEFIIFAVVGGVALGFSQLCMWAVAGLLGRHYLVAKTFSVGVTVFVNFYGKRLCLFHKPRGRGDKSLT